MDHPPGRWFGSLHLDFERIGPQTVLRRSRHVGPLRVQRPFREPDGACQVYVLHPPGGIVGGDELWLQARLESQARALLTTPGASKFYRSAGPLARAHQHFVVGPDAGLEWLPQETIVYDGAKGRLSTRVELHQGARFVGWDIACLGRPAAGERFTHGEWTQRFELWCEEKPLWIEQTCFGGGDRVLSAPWGLAGHPVLGQLVLHPADPEMRARAAGALAGSSASPGSLDVPPLANEDYLASTLLPHPGHPSTLVCRYLGGSTVRARAAFCRVWNALRPQVLGSPAVPPRIWAT